MRRSASGSTPKLAARSLGILLLIGCLANCTTLGGFGYPNYGGGGGYGYGYPYGYPGYGYRDPYYYSLIDFQPANL